MEREFIKHIATPVILQNRHAALQQVIADLESLEIKKENYPVEPPTQKIALLSARRNLIVKQHEEIVNRAEDVLERANDDARLEKEADLEAAKIKQAAAIQEADERLIEGIEQATQQAADQALKRYQADVDSHREALERARITFKSLDEEMKNYGDIPMDDEEIAEVLQRESAWESDTFARETEIVRETRRAFYKMQVDPLTNEANRLPDGEEKQELLAKANAEVQAIKSEYPKPRAEDYTVEQGGTKNV